MRAYLLCNLQVIRNRNQDFGVDVVSFHFVKCGYLLVQLSSINKFEQPGDLDIPHTLRLLRQSYWDELQLCACGSDTLIIGKERAVVECSFAAL